MISSTGRSGAWLLLHVRFTYVARFVEQEFGEARGELFRMNVSKWKIGGGVTATLVLLTCAFALPEATPASKAAKPASSQPAEKHKAPFSAHPGSKSTNSKSRTASPPSSHNGKTSKKASGRGLDKIDSERARQIQEALVRQHYLSGEPTGKWDANTEDALRRYQVDHGWQDKTVPDSRALIKLGLGPNHDHLLNPESAMTTTPESPRPATAPQRAPGAPTPPTQPQP